MPDRTVTVALDARLAAFVQRLVDEGAHPDAAAVLRAALVEYEAAGATAEPKLEYESLPAASAAAQDTVPTEVLLDVLRRADADLARGAYTDLRSRGDLETYMTGLRAEASIRAERKRLARRRA
ncbi:hypothetical protein [Caenispirillum bisanense]|uniref:Uncharacterized protein n=1 Tax=Caenispirillum bisanense TaxID=414052 RepID=A0A286G1H3_9PROT|nr:hypothetical protein [Caenispirillum bisanense]SOD89400.1 hypothetical protein SAMN05421508_101207 [Caenispirillum bisanense]